MAPGGWGRPRTRSVGVSGGSFVGGRGFGGASADEPARLPWLIRLDRNVDGQNHLGVTDLIVRSNNSQTSLNEAVALELLLDPDVGIVSLGSPRRFLLRPKGGGRSLRFTPGHGDLLVLGGTCQRTF